MYEWLVSEAASGVLNYESKKLTLEALDYVLPSLSTSSECATMNKVLVAGAARGPRGGRGPPRQDQS